jgi:hypothetical protein
MSYAFDFEVEIGTGTGQSYPLALLHSPAGEARETMHFPFDELALDSALKSLEIALLSASGIRRQAFSPEEQSVQDFGKQLFSALLTGELRSRYDMSRDEARQKGQGLRLKLRILAPELAKLPWEFLYDSRLGEYICLSRETPIVRYIEIPQAVQPLSIQPPLQILGMVTSPSDLPVLDVDREKQRVEKALERLQCENLAKLTWLEGETWRDLQRAMRAGPWHIFHFVGHGGFDEEKDEGTVALSDESGSAQFLSASDLGMLLADHRSLRMVVLNACEGARSSKHDIFSSTASILVRRGMPAVLAMQYPITDRAAIEFSQTFYETLSDGLPIDSAVGEARKAISLAMTNSLEWGTPVLFMRSPQGVIFDLHTQRQHIHTTSSDPLDPETEKRTQQLYTDGLAAFYVEDWDKACRLFQQAVATKPGFTLAETKLEEARRQRKWAGQYAHALEARDAGSLDDALSTLQSLTADCATYKDAAALLQQLNRQKQLAGMYSDARSMLAAGQWEAVIKIFAQIAAQDPAYPDKDGLLASAQKEQAEKQRQEELQQLYNSGVHAIAAGQWIDAQQYLQQVAAAAPEFQETRRLLQKVEGQIAADQELRRKQEQVAQLGAQARALLQAHRWQEAIDKIAEIQKLDPAFTDPDHIAAQAKTALDREAAETRRQAELAAFYTEASRLVKDGKYAAALEKWNQLQASAPGYPDRDRIIPVAKKKLAAEQKANEKQQANLHGSQPGPDQQPEPAGDGKEASPEAAAEARRQAWIAQAEKALAAKDFAKAEEWFKQAGETDRVQAVQAQRENSWIEDTIKSAAAFEAHDEWTQAARSYQRILERHPDHVEAAVRLKHTTEEAGLLQRYQQAVSLAEARQPEEAQKILLQILEARPQYKDAARYLADIVAGKYKPHTSGPVVRWIKKTLKIVGNAGIWLLWFVFFLVVFLVLLLISLVSSGSGSTGYFTYSLAAIPASILLASLVYYGKLHRQELRNALQAFRAYTSKKAPVSADQEGDAIRPAWQKPVIIMAILFGLTICVLLGSFSAGNLYHSFVINSLTPSADAIPTPEGKLVLDNNFESKNAEDIHPITGTWAVADDETGNHFYKAACSDFTNSICQAQFGPDDFFVGTIQFRFRFVDNASASEPSGDLFLLFHSHHPDIGDGFAITISESTSKYIFSHQTQEINHLSLINDKAQTIAPLTWYTTRISIKATRVQVYQDDVLVGDWNTAGYSTQPGRLYLEVGPATSVQLDDFKVWQADQ